MILHLYTHTLYLELMFIIKKIAQIVIKLYFMKDEVTQGT